MRESKHVTHAFLTLAPDGTSGQLHILAALPQWKSHHYPLDNRLGGLQSQYEHGGK
jgi:hypothetical protein